jgi:hypothetical protein
MSFLNQNPTLSNDELFLSLWTVPPANISVFLAKFQLFYLKIERWP